MGNDSPTIRRAEASDAAAMKACVESAYRHYISRIGKPPGPMVDDYPTVVKRHQAFVAESGGQVVGVLVLILKDKGMLLDNVAVRPEFQGSGLGRKLMELAESEARRQGFAQLDLYTHELMTENIDMYKRLGYMETERRTESGYPRVYMCKRLT